MAGLRIIPRLDIKGPNLIKGIQLEGRVTELQGEEEKRAQHLYGEKFPIVGAVAKVPPAIVKALAKVRWFRLIPERFYFIDNSKGFGHRDEIAPGPS